jgi:hypothetical protein
MALGHAFFAISLVVDQGLDLSSSGSSASCPGQAIVSTHLLNAQPSHRLDP